MIFIVFCFFKKATILVITHQSVLKATSVCQPIVQKTLLWEIHLEVESKDMNILILPVIARLFTKVLYQLRIPSQLCDILHNTW